MQGFRLIPLPGVGQEQGQAVSRLGRVRQTGRVLLRKGLISRQSFPGYLHCLVLTAQDMEHSRELPADFRR